MERIDIMLRVKEATRTQHERLEALLPFWAVDRLSYREVLTAFLGIIEPLEDTLAEFDLPAELELPKRRRAFLLVQDLVAMGLPQAAVAMLPRCHNVPRLHSMASALGSMYVTEGSTLGGQFIAKVVQKSCGFRELAGCSFFYSYGPEVGEMWRKFSAIVRERVATPGAQQEFVAAAQSTFVAFERWLEHR